MGWGVMKFINKLSLGVLMPASLILLSATDFAQGTSSKKSPPHPTDPGSKQLLAKLESSIPRLMKDGDVPGLSIAVIRSARVVWQQSYGVVNSATG